MTRDQAGLTLPDSVHLLHLSMSPAGQAGAGQMAVDVTLQHSGQAGEAKVDVMGMWGAMPAAKAVAVLELGLGCAVSIKQVAILLSFYHQSLMFTIVRDVCA